MCCTANYRPNGEHGAIGLCEKFTFQRLIIHGIADLSFLRL